MDFNPYKFAAIVKQKKRRRKEEVLRVLGRDDKLFRKENSIKNAQRGGKNRIRKWDGKIIDSLGVWSALHVCVYITKTDAAAAPLMHAGANLKNMKCLNGSNALLFRQQQKTKQKFHIGPHQSNRVVVSWHRVAQQTVSSTNEWTSPLERRRNHRDTRRGH